MKTPLKQPNTTPKAQAQYFHLTITTIRPSNMNENTTKIISKYNQQNKPKLPKHNQENKPKLPISKLKPNHLTV